MFIRKRFETVEVPENHHQRRRQRDKSATADTDDDDELVMHLDRKLPGWNCFMTLTSHVLYGYAPPSDRYLEIL